MSAAKAGGGAKPPTPAGDKRPGSSAGAKGAKTGPGKGKAGDKNANGEAPAAAGMLLREEDKVRALSSYKEGKREKQLGGVLWSPWTCLAASVVYNKLFSRL